MSILPFLTRGLLPIVCLTSFSVTGEEVFSGVAGYSTTALPANRDVYVSVPFARETPVLGAVSLIDSLDGEGNQRIRIEGVGGLEAGSLVEGHSVRLLEGVDAGLRFDIVENDQDSLLVAFEGNAPSPGTMAALEASWTLDSLFPPGSQTVFHESTGPFVTQRRSELLVLSSRSGTGLSSAARVYYLENGAWIEAGEEGRAAGSDKLPSDAALVIRHPVSVTSTSWTAAGVGFHGVLTSRFQPAAGTTGSAAVGLLRPGGVRLGDSGLGDSEVRPSTDLTEAGRTDLLHVFSLTRPDNPSPVASYFRLDGQWRSVAPGNAVSDDEPVPAGSVLMIENAAPAVAVPSDWSQTGGAAN